ncbi:ankyrin repeat domain-containing protein [Simkania sp.]|uniref:ankyrin repeat domain-containing protein n=1 Tax=Simkania sp. TaxID=34094 RepID=UPI003B521B16
MNFDYKNYQTYAVSIGLQLCSGTLLSKAIFPIIVKEGAIYSALLGTSLSAVETATFYTTSLEENLQNKTLIALATLALAYFATTRLIAGPLFGRISVNFDASKAFKLCLSSFATYMGYTIWKEKGQKETESSHDTNEENISSEDLKQALYGLKDVNDRDEYEQTALHLAAINGNDTSITTLLNASSDIHAKNNRDNTPLHFAAYKGHINAIEVLLKAGSDIHATNIDGYTPLHMAAEQGHVKAIEVLLKAGSDIHARDNSDWTALCLAVCFGYEKAIEVLLKAGSDIHAKDKEGITPKILVERSKNKEAIMALFNAHAKKN